MEGLVKSEFCLLCCFDGPFGSNRNQLDIMLGLRVFTETWGLCMAGVSQLNPSNYLQDPGSQLAMNQKQLNMHLAGMISFVFYHFYSWCHKLIL